jgi:hypothetical protein
MPPVKRPATHPLVKALVPDPSKPPLKTVKLAGLIGESPNADDTRLWLDDSLTAYIDIPTAAIRYTQDLPGTAGTTVYVDADAQLTHGSVAARTAQASFLAGSIIGTHLAAAARMQALGAPPVTLDETCSASQDCPVTTDLSCNFTLEGCHSVDICPTTDACATQGPSCNVCPTDLCGPPTGPIRCPTTPRNCPSLACPSASGVCRTVDLACPSVDVACPTRVGCPPPTASRCPSVNVVCPTVACPSIACPTRINCPPPTTNVACHVSVACPTRVACPAPTIAAVCATVNVACPTRAIVCNPVSGGLACPTAGACPSIQCATIGGCGQTAGCPVEGQ